MGKRAVVTSDAPQAVAAQPVKKERRPSAAALRKLALEEENERIREETALKNDAYWKKYRNPMQPADAAAGPKARGSFDTLSVGESAVDDSGTDGETMHALNEALKSPYELPPQAAA